MTAIVKKTILISMCIALSMAMAFACLSAGAEAVTDYSQKGYSFSTVSAAEVLRQLHADFYAGEEEYLLTHPELDIRYSDHILSSAVGISYEPSDDTVSVRPTEYSYTAANGKTIVWTPTHVDGAEMTDGVAQVTAGQRDYVTVDYTAQLPIDADELNVLLTYYYDAAKQQSDRLAAHNRAVADYAAYVAALETYNELLVPQYEQYLRDYAVWKRANDKYIAYENEYARYLAEQGAYDHYDPIEAQAQYEADMQLYQQYLADMELYEQLYAQYLTSMNDPEVLKYRTQLSILAYIYAKCEKCSLYATLSGDLVTQIFGKKEELKMALVMEGRDTEAVNRADRAIRNLRDLLKKYELCKTDEEKYAFYITCYDDLSLNCANMLRCLDYFYRTDFIKNYIKNNNKTRIFEITIAQLYELTVALDDETVANYEEYFNKRSSDRGYFDENYTISGKTPADILGECVIEDTDSARPSEYGVPYIPQEPVRPDEVTKPLPPSRPQQPIAPIPVPEAGPEPQRVPEPQLPEEVSPPLPLQLSPEEQSLQQTFDAGMTPREPRTDGYMLTVHTQIKKYFRNQQTVEVFFYESRDAKEPYFISDAERGSFVEQPTHLPTEQKTGYVCVFDGWTYSDGEAVDWNEPREGTELHVYPRFQEIPNEYPVTWIIDGTAHTQYAAYDSYPHYDGTPTKTADADGRQYRFVGWDRDIVPMTDLPVTYEARFEPSCLITWITEDSQTVTSCWKGEVPVYPYGTPTKPPFGYYEYIFDGWDHTPTDAQGDSVYRAIFTPLTVLMGGGRPALIRYETDRCIAEFTSGESDALYIRRLLDIAYTRDSGVYLVNRNGPTVLDIDSADIYRLVQNGVAYLRFEREQTGFREYRYALHLYDEQSNEIRCDCDIAVTVSDAMNSANSKLYAADDTSHPLRLSVADGKTNFSVRDGQEYIVVTRYNVFVSGTCAEYVFVNAESGLIHNDTVSISIGDIPEGKYIQRLVAIDVSGNEIAVIDNRFSVPSDDVTVFAVLADRYYTVRFRSDGKVISTRTYKYGDIPESPITPFKAPDGEYSYNFIGWDSDISVVYADAVYNAVFEAVPMEKIATDMSKQLKWAIAGVSVIGVAVLFLAVGLPVILVRRRRKASRAKAAAESKSDAGAKE